MPQSGSALLNLLRNQRADESPCSPNGLGTLRPKNALWLRRMASMAPTPGVSTASWYLTMTVKRLFSTSFQDQQLIITRDVLAFEPLDGDELDDVIPLCEIEKVENLGNVERGEGCWGTLHGLTAVSTMSTGYNMGRKYLISMHFPCAVGGQAWSAATQPPLVEHPGREFTNQGQFHECLTKLVWEARQRALDRSLAGKFRRSRTFVRHHFRSLNVQISVAMLLIANFFLNAWEAQLEGTLELEDGSPSPMAVTFHKLDITFTAIFTVELSLNLYAHWMQEFITDGWCIFDFIVVATSLIAPFLDENEIPITIFRLLRAFRVLRLFGRLKSIRSIVNALTASLVPVVNAFFIMFIVLSLYAIVGVNFYSKIDPDDFGNLSRAIVTLFRIAAGETWVDGMPIVKEETGRVDWPLGFYTFSFILVNNWTLLQVSVAVLLDNFVSETSREKSAQQQLVMEEKRSHDSIGNALDPLLKIIATEYVDDKHLSAFLSELFALLVQLGQEEATVPGQTRHGVSLSQRAREGEGHVMDKQDKATAGIEAMAQANNTQTIKPVRVPSTNSCPRDELTCDQLITAFGRLNLKLVSGGGSQVTQLHLCRMDVALMTENGKLAKPNGALGEAEFLQVMRKQVTFYIKRKLQRSVTETETQHEFSTAATLKIIVGEIDSIKSRHDALASTHDVMACRQDKMAESLSDIQAALASLNASVSDVAATVGKIAKGGGVEKGSGGDALRRSLAVDSFLRSHFLSSEGVKGHSEQRSAGELFLAPSTTNTPRTQHAQENADVLSEFQTETITNLGDLANLEAGAEAGDVTASSSSSNTEWERAREVLSSTMSRRAPQKGTSANLTPANATPWTFTSAVDDENGSGEMLAKRTAATGREGPRGVRGPARDTETHDQGEGPARARIGLVDQRHLLSDERYDV